jgi:hypothetical protein
MCRNRKKPTFGDFCEVPFVFGPLLNWVLNVIIHVNERVKSHPLMSRPRCFDVEEPEEDDDEEDEEEVSAKLK